MSRHKNRDHRHGTQEPQAMGTSDLSEGSARPLAQEAKRVKSKNVIGTAMPYVPPAQEAWTGTALGYRPKAKKRRPSLYPSMA